MRPYADAPRKSRFEFLRHPLLIGAGVAVVSAVFASLLIPSFMRVGADRPKELELKHGIVTRIGQSSAETLARGLALARRDVRAAGGEAGDEGVTAYRKLNIAWLTASSAIDGDVLTYFPNAHRRWATFVDAVNAYLLLAVNANDRLDDTPVRIRRSRHLMRYLRPLSSDPRFKRIPWELLKKGHTNPESWMPTILDLLLVRRGELMGVIAGSYARGFKHSVWSLG